MTDFYFIPEYGRLEESERFAKEQGLRFEYNDFILPDVLDEEDEIKRRIESYKASGRDIDRLVLGSRGNIPRPGLLLHFFIQRRKRTVGTTGTGKSAGVSACFLFHVFV